jgi:hypothetical protein
MHHTCSALHRPRAADRRRAQARPAFKGYSLQVINRARWCRRSLMPTIAEKA